MNETIQKNGKYLPQKKYQKKMKEIKKYKCLLCVYSTGINSNYNKHLRSLRHINLEL